MNTQTDYFQEARRLVETTLDSLADQLDTLVESLIQKQLDVWSTRFYRHRFRAFEAHGLLAISVSPPIGRESFEWGSVSEIPEHMLRCAILDLHNEATSLINSYHELVWKFTPCELPTLLSKTPK